MKPCIVKLLGLCVCLFSVASWVQGETYAVPEKSTQRKLKVTRHYEIRVIKGNPSVAALPAMMSIWGQSNWQIVKSSKFQYSEPPDKEEIIADNLGEYRRSYQLTWNAPKSDKITVDQTMDVELSCFPTIYTTAKLPYAESVKTRFSASLGADEKAGIDPNLAPIQPICDGILKKAKDAEETVELVCDWINENIKFAKGKRSAAEAIAQKQGSCTPMSKIACCMLRKIGIPAEMLDAKFVESDSGHAYVEVYFPDAGWIIYDLSNHSRGFKSLDCMVAVGWSYRSGTPTKLDWTNGYFCESKDAAPFKDFTFTNGKVLRKSPAKVPVFGATVMKTMAPAVVKTRQRPIRELIMDLTVPPGVREYTDNKL